MTEQAKQLKKEYQKKWQQENKEHLAEYRKQWRKDNPEKQRQYTANYWNKKAGEV